MLYEQKNKVSKGGAILAEINWSELQNGYTSVLKTDLTQTNKAFRK